VDLKLTKGKKNSVEAIHLPQATSATNHSIKMSAPESLESTSSEFKNTFYSKPPLSGASVNKG
jgi:hypothetical protein